MGELIASKKAEGSLQRRLRARRVVRQMRLADRFIISHTKSGRTWLRAMISHVYHLEYGVPADNVIKFDNLHKLDPAIPKLFFYRDTSIPTFSLTDGLTPLPTDRRTLFLIRDPRDVAVSFYFHIKNRASYRELGRKRISDTARALELYEFVASETLGVLRVIDHLNRWHEDMQRMPQRLVVKYEQIRSDPTGELDRVMAFLDQNFERDVIDRSVEFASFDNLSRKEADGFFKSNNLQPRKVSDRDSYKVRRGKVGGYRDYFDDEQSAFIDSLVRDRLNPIYGYC